MEKFKNISIFSAIDKNDFTSDQWSISYLNSKSSISKFEKECKKIFQNGCSEIEFENSFQTYNWSSNPIKFKIDLYFSLINEIEEEISKYKLLLDFINVASILFGLNIFKLSTFFSLIKIRFKIHSFLLFFSLLIASMYHSFHIVNEIVNGELTQSQHYQQETLNKMPAIIFCLNYDQTRIDKNQNLTGRHLEALTSDIKVEMLFKKIEYLNRSNSWIELKSSFVNHEFRIETFYFLNKKCFKIRQERI